MRHLSQLATGLFCRRLRQNGNQSKRKEVLGFGDIKTISYENEAALKDELKLCDLKSG